MWVGRTPKLCPGLLWGSAAACHGPESQFRCPRSTVQRIRTARPGSPDLGSPSQPCPLSVPSPERLADLPPEPAQRPADTRTAPAPPPPPPPPAEPRDPPRRARPSWPCRPAEKLAPRSRPSPLHMLRLSGAAHRSQLGLPPPAPASHRCGLPRSSHSEGSAGERP